MYVQNYTEIAHRVHDLSYVVQNWAIVQTSKGNFSQSGCNMENQAIPLWSHYCRETAYWFAWILDKICRSSVKKCVLQKPTWWWRYKRAMWKTRGRGSELPCRECVCEVITRSGERRRRLAGNRQTDTHTDGRTHTHTHTHGRTDGRRRKHSLLAETTTESVCFCSI